MESTNKNLPRDVFLYLLSIIALGMTAVNFGNLLFQFINIYVPDAVADRYMSASAYYGSIRWDVSALIIVFPVLIWTWRFLKKDIAANPEKRDLKIRKWLLYLTLFIAGVVVIGDLIACAYNFMGGDVTTRFALKTVTILAVSGSIFFYYLNELKDKTVRANRIFSWIIMALVAVGLVAGFVVAGSPAAQRVTKFDRQRVEDLSLLQNQIVSYWQSKQKLPAALDDLKNSISGFVPPVDPQEPYAPYEYSVVGSLQFTLCAIFQGNDNEKGNPSVPMDYGIQANWNHGIGRTCFTRTIDPDFFPPIGKPAPIR